MAPPKSPWNKPLTNASKVQDPGKSPAPERKSKNAVPTAPPADTNSAAQEDEIEALKAIYMDDFEEVEAKGAWHVS